jgi:aminoglycoside phosphotransferase family enzyme
MVLEINPHPPKKASKDTNLGTSYIIEAELSSKPARLFFAYQQADPNNKVVIKILRQYEDPRYKLKDRTKRQMCQLEALQWNTRFANDIYLGLAPVLKRDKVSDKRSNKSILLGRIIKDAEKAKSSLDYRYEFALIMKRLPENRQLNFLLENGDKADQKRYVSLLTRSVVKLHQDLLGTPENRNEARKWGSFKQLFKKLDENLDLVKPLISGGVLTPFSSYTRLENILFKWFRLRRLRKNFNYLKKTFSKVKGAGKYPEMFEQRLQKNYIHRCHGDLKAPNIWIDEDDTIHLLDAIDFSPAFCNIDILSDFAMLVIDVEVRTMSSKLANEMIEEYLRELEQTDNVSRAVLAYYLAEKAFVGAAISIMFDDAPELGQSYLKIAKRRMRSLILLQDNKFMTLQTAKSIQSPNLSIEYTPLVEPKLARV